MIRMVLLPALSPVTVEMMEVMVDPVVETVDWAEAVAVVPLSPETAAMAEIMQQDLAVTR